MKRKNVWAAIALTMMAAVVAGCSKEDSNPENNTEELHQEIIVNPVELPTSLELTRAELEMVKSSNEFAFNLFRTAQDEKESQILSPISITFALGMLNNGAAGETQQQINKVLGFADGGAEGINDFCYKMLEMAPTLDPLTKVMIANTIYMNEPYELMPDFILKANAFYHAEPETRDFSDGETRDVINKWAADHTEQMIKEVLKEDEFNPSSVSYLLNAIYFKGNWAKKFDKAETRDEHFVNVLLEDETETLEIKPQPMMHQRDKFDYCEIDDYQALRLPYGSGSFVMTVLLPKTDSRAVPKVPTAEVWEQLNQRMHSTQVDVKLPRFESDTDINLVPVMRKLGMVDAFSPYTADFSRFCVWSKARIYIGLMKQVAKIKLDEEGTEAAAVTVIDMKDGSAGVDDYPVFHANHPFLYVISEQKTGAVFFIGQFTGR